MPIKELELKQKIKDLEEVVFVIHDSISELLKRLNHEVHELNMALSPAEFIPMHQQTNNILTIDKIAAKELINEKLSYIEELKRLKNIDLETNAIYEHRIYKRGGK